MAIPLVLVHTGTQFPSYLNDCIALANKQNFDIHLLLSSALHHYVDKSEVKLIIAEDFEGEGFADYQLSNYPQDFKDGFFTRTSSRFLLLHRYAQQTNLKSFFHIENDVALFDDLQTTQKVLEATDKEMFLVMDHPYRCVPSILWFRSSCILAKLAEFLRLSLSHTDMENLAFFFNSYRELVGNLPIMDQCIENDFKIDFNNKLADLQLIFDGAALGQYLFGIDNENPAETVGFINETTVFSPATLNFTWRNQLPYAASAGTNKIANLHMHCKNLKQLLQ